MMKITPTTSNAIRKYFIRSESVILSSEEASDSIHESSLECAANRIQSFALLEAWERG